MARHCGYCGSRGHNRRTCDSLTDAHRRQLAEYRRRLDDGSYVAGSVDESRLIGRITQTAATLAKRTGTNPLTGEAAVKPTRRQRKCSYCQSFEHDRRRCDALAKDKLIWQEATRIARADIVRRVQELGVGIGTLYVVRTGYYASDKSWQYGPRPLIVMAAHDGAESQLVEHHHPQHSRKSRQATESRRRNGASQRRNTRFLSHDSVHLLGIVARSRRNALGRN